MYVFVIMFRHVNIGKCTGASCKIELVAEGGDGGRGDLGFREKE